MHICIYVWMLAAEMKRRSSETGRAYVYPTDVLPTYARPAILLSPRRSTHQGEAMGRKRTLTRDATVRAPKDVVVLTMLSVEPLS